MLVTDNYCISEQIARRQRASMVKQKDNYDIAEGKTAALPLRSCLILARPSANSEDNSRQQFHK
jgi:hypothetical protein